MQLYMSLCEENNCIRIIAFALIHYFRTIAISIILRRMFPSNVLKNVAYASAFVDAYGAYKTASFIRMTCYSFTYIPKVTSTNNRKMEMKFLVIVFISVVIEVSFTN